MDRYGSPYRYRRQESHRVRNSLLGVLAALLLVVGFASTEAGASLMERAGLPSLRGVSPFISTAAPRGAPNPTAVALDPGSPPLTQVPGATPPAPQPNVSGVPTDSQQPTVAPTAPAPVDGTPGAVKTAAPVVTAVPTATPPPPLPTGAGPLEVAQTYLGNWAAGRYDRMLGYVSPASLREYGYTPQTLAARYADIAETVTQVRVAPQLLPEARAEAAKRAPAVQLPYRVTITTRIAGEIVETNALPLVVENNAWRVKWSPGLIFRDLTGANRIRKQTFNALRGGIFDRNGKPLAIDGEIDQLGVVPAAIKNEPDLLARMTAATGISAAYIQRQYEGKDPSGYWSIREIARDRIDAIRSRLVDVPGVEFRKVRGRVYPQGTVLAAALGYVTEVFAEDLAAPNSPYFPGDVVGKNGLELWGEPYLRGQAGGRIYMVTPDGAPVRTIAERQPLPGNNMYLNIDLDVQVKAEQELGGRPGALVALDPNTGEILALVSQPSYDPNKFVVGISERDWKLYNATTAGNPLIERAASAAFPMASTFKPITTAAAYANKLPNLDRRFLSDGTWERLGLGQVRRDWKRGGHGSVTLLDGIIESIDTVYYDLGFELHQKCYDCLTEHAKQWKLGAPLGVPGLPREKGGLVPGPGAPDPGWSPGDNVNLAIGQGSLQATPLQVAFVYAAIGNGGTFYRPHLINRIVAAEDSATIVKAWKPEALGRIPVSPQVIALLQQGLQAVTSTPKGTAFSVFRGARFSSAGKTGTGQQDQQDPFAWYAGYAPAVKPQLVVVALKENAGEGSKLSAPVVRRVMEFYFDPRRARP